MTPLEKVMAMLGGNRKLEDVVERRGRCVGTLMFLDWRREISEAGFEDQRSNCLLHFTRLQMIHIDMYAICSQLSASFCGSQNQLRDSTFTQLPRWHHHGEEQSKSGAKLSSVMGYESNGESWIYRVAIWKKGT